MRTNSKLPVRVNSKILDTNDIKTCSFIEMRDYFSNGILSAT